MTMDNNGGIQAGTPCTVMTANGLVKGVFVAWTYKPEQVNHATPVYVQRSAAIVQIPSDRRCIVCLAEFLFFPHLQPEESATEQPAGGRRN